MNIGAGGVGTGFGISGSGFLGVAQAANVTNNAIARVLSSRFMLWSEVKTTYGQVTLPGVLVPGSASVRQVVRFHKSDL